jgi:hypothetical protein
MWKPTKTVLFLLMSINATLAGISLAYVDWNAINKNDNVFRELQLPVLFFLLSIYFLFPYIKSIRKDKRSNKK